VYAKQKQQWNRRLLPRTDEANARYENFDNDPRGEWKPGDLSARNFYSKGTYSIECPSGRTIEGPPPGTYWRVSEDTFWDLDEDKRIWWGEDGNGMPSIKRFLSEVRDLVPETIWTYEEVGHTQEAKQQVLRILGDTEQPITPKPVDLVRRLLWIASEPGDVILDSFAGTATTAHAALQMARLDDGARKFVLVQMLHDTKSDELSQSNLCRDLTAERVRRVMKGYEFTRRGPRGKRTKISVEGLGGSFTYAQVGEPLFGEYKDWGDKPPAFETLARYVFYTETSRECDVRKFNEKTGFIGATEAGGGTSYYLLYTPNLKADRELSLATLDELAKKDKNRHWVIYCEKIWYHADQLQKFEREYNKRVRAMQVPFNLK
jgi:adenine-specific DNA-methyltransferase